ncbi:hypothetical protein C8236_17875, partial [Paracidovorax avenae]
MDRGLSWRPRPSGTALRPGLGTGGAACTRRRRPCRGPRGRGLRGRGPGGGAWRRGRRGRRALRTAGRP